MQPPSMDSSADKDLETSKRNQTPSRNDSVIPRESLPDIANATAAAETNPHRHHSGFHESEDGNQERTTATSSSSTSSSGGAAGSAAERRPSPKQCHGCRRPITDRYLLKAVELYWHEDCLKCSCCDCRLGEVGCTLFTKAGLLLCRRDYLRLFGESGYCCVCSKIIPSFEMVMRARGNAYHLECFACHQCHHRFCVGDKYYLQDNKILCEFDYQQKFLHSKHNGHCLLPDNEQSGQPIAIDDRGRPDLPCVNDDRSSGYGTPSPNN